MRCFVAITGVILSVAQAVGADAIDFNRDIRPILADNCFHCHGHDAATRKAGLRLDEQEEAFAHGAIVPGDPEESEAMRRMLAEEPGRLMPPPDSARSLNAEQIDLISRWIAEGAEYKPHWAFIPLGDGTAASAPGTVEDTEGWARNPIDLFVLRRLQQEGLSPAPEAPAEALLRRVTLDLTGLPPTVEEVEALLADEAPGAYERAVDRLLDSPAYGERMATDWMDAARYADTFGYQNDLEMNMWPWRDWAIQAFNDNLPYDEFIRWQLAGDLLPEPTREQRLATAFNRLHRQTNEGGSIDEEFRIEYVADRTNTFATAFLGLTMDCARCHDHKYDPISQREYFKLFAFFDNIDESGIYSHYTRATPSPSMFLSTESQEAERAALEAAVAQAEAALDAVTEGARERFAAWLANSGREFPAAAPVLHLPLDEVEEGKTPNAADPENPATFAPANTLEEGIEGQAVRFTGDDPIVAEGAPIYDRTQPFTVSLWAKVDAHDPHNVVLHQTRASQDAASRGWELLLTEGRPTFALTHFWPGNSVRVEAREPLPLKQWAHLAVSYDGSSTAGGIRIFLDGEALALDVVRDNLYKTILYDNPADTPPFRLGERSRDFGFANKLMDEVKLFDRVLSPLEVRALASQEALDEHLAPLAGAPDAAADEALFAYYTLAVDRHHREARATVRQAREAANVFVTAIPEIMVMEEMPEPRQTYLLARGAYDSPADPVEPGTPEHILPFPEDLPRNRLGLAQWMVLPENPLTARVAVNRYWQLHFGRGLVETQEDFGTQASAPSHPELLDWLALHFKNSGWDIKALNRLIVTSATYRQESAPRPEIEERDPFNELLAHGPRQRLQAEQIRDSALAASGLLVDTIGGPSVKPYQPAQVWRDASQVRYTQDTGDGLYRRSMYTFWKRTVPPPNMLTFDAVTREVCVARREVTSTPLQALILLNDEQFVEAARVLAENALAEVPDDAERLTHLFRTITTRNPYPRERDILHQAYEEQHAYFTARTDEAMHYTSTGDAPPAANADPAALAATTAIAQMLMNLDEFQVKY